MGGYIEYRQETRLGLAAQSVPHSKSSTPAGFWLLPERILEIGQA